MMYRLVVVFVGLSIFTACQPSDELVQRTDYGRAQGSTYAISYVAKRDVRFQESFDSILEVIDLSMSTYRTDSRISALNKGEVLLLDEHFRRVITRSDEIYQQTDGLFDISILPLMKLWNFERKNQRIPDSASIAKAVELVGWSKINSANLDSFALPAGMQIDVNAIAQGYTVDVISLFLESKGVENYLVEVGGEIRAKGENIDGQVWRIGIEKPQEDADGDGDRFQTIVNLSNAGLATSGSYRKYIEDTLTGKRYSHAVNPISGYATNDPLMSVTVIAPNAMDADAYATALLVMGLEKSKVWMRENPSYPVYLIYHDSYRGWQEEYNEAFAETIIK